MRYLQIETFYAVFNPTNTMVVTLKVTLKLKSFEARNERHDTGPIETCCENDSERMYLTICHILSFLTP